MAFRFEELTSSFLSGVISLLDTRSRFRLAQVCQFWHVYVYNTTESLTLSSFWPAVSNETLERVLLHEPRPSNLREISLANCQNVSPGVVKTIAQIETLESVDLSRCTQLSDKDLYFLSLLKNLRSVQLSNCSQITTCGIKQLATLHIERLNLSGSFGFDHTALKYLSHIKKTLRYLDLSFCSQVSSNSLKHLEGLDLKSLSLKMCIRIGNNGLKHLVKLHNLEELNLYGCSQVTDDGLKSIGALAQLVSLDISYCTRITDVGISHLGRLHHLTELEIEGCSGVSEVSLRNLNSIKKLNAYGCSIQDHTCLCCFDGGSNSNENSAEGDSSHYNSPKESYHIRRGDGCDHRRTPAKHVTFCV